MRDKLFIILTVAAGALTQVCDIQNTVELKNRTYNDLIFEDGEYFVDNITEVERGCVCMKKPCARKCCPLHQIYYYDSKESKCINVSTEFKPPIWEGFTLKEDFDMTNELHFFTTQVKCQKKHLFFFLGSFVEEFYFNTDGTLQFQYKDNDVLKFKFETDRYCIDDFMTEDNVTRFDALVCLDKSEERYFYVFNATCMLISCFFMILTIAVYAILPELRSTLPGMNMIACLTCFFIRFMLMGSVQLGLHMGTMTARWCFGLAFIIYFTSLASYFWLNVMCLDIWIKFRRVNVTTHGVSADKRNTFLRYCAYAFGLPAVMTIILGILEASDRGRYNRFLPNLRRQGCFLVDMAILIYFYVPMLLICVVNLVLFLLVTKRFLEIKEQTQRLQKKDTQQFSIFLKLFVVTGFSWILEAISAYLPEIDYVWKISDAYNILVGLIIFIMFICTKKILNDLKQRCGFSL